MNKSKNTHCACGKKLDGQERCGSRCIDCYTIHFRLKRMTKYESDKRP